MRASAVAFHCCVYMCLFSHMRITKMMKIWRRGTWTWAGWRRKTVDVWLFHRVRFSLLACANSHGQVRFPPFRWCFLSCPVCWSSCETWIWHLQISTSDTFHEKKNFFHPIWRFFFFWNLTRRLPKCLFWNHLFFWIFVISVFIIFTYFMKTLFIQRKWSGRWCVTIRSQSVFTLIQSDIILIGKLQRCQP